ncbi:Uncharacterised protein [Enterobacter cancerogenus]|uniref:Uncharacterized protein n=1 Tax=Enterobacter cancerogenus TaxID=69218 RepID=A0A484Z749_9ENTR|nr:Uncharacterised protein [Enterobacter cancerogenus]
MHFYMRSLSMSGKRIAREKETIAKNDRVV